MIAVLEEDTKRFLDFFAVFAASADANDEIIGIVEENVINRDSNTAVLCKNIEKIVCV